MIGIGQTLGNYHVVAKLGSGGMGAVYMAEHPLIGKKVALKVIHRELSMNKEVVTRFFNEARAVNQIGNDHIVDISDFGRTPEGEYFFIMELLSGTSLGDLLQKERVLDPRRALHIAAQIADALGAAHQVGIIHRDLKPDNVFLVHKLGEPDFVKILDFGLAKLIAEGGPGNLTQKGVILGTPQYMSPEQCESRKEVDGRTDVYSLGILLYQMVCGQLPFDGQSMGEVLVKQVAAQPPPPRAVNPAVPPSVEQIILRCLGKKPEARFQNMQELHQALLDPDRYLMGGSVGGAQARTQFMPRASGQHPAAPEIGAVATQQTMMASGPARARPSAPQPQQNVAEARTMFLDGGSHAAAPTMAQGTEPRASMMLPAMQPPAAPANATMLLDPAVAAGPMAAQRKSGAGKWILAALLLVLVGGGAAAAIVLSKKQTADDAQAQPAAAAPAATSPADGGALAVKPAAEPVISALPAPRVKVAVTSDPKGAKVFDETTGTDLGTTPLTLEIERDAEHMLVFRHDDCGEKRKPIKASNDTEILVELQRLPRSAPPPDRKAPRPKKPASKDLQKAIDDDSILEPTM